MSRNIEIILLSSEYGCGRRGASLGPQAVMLEDFQRKGDFFKSNDVINLIADNRLIDLNSQYVWAKNIDKILEYGNKSLLAIENSIEKNKFPIILSGDHSNAIATISAFKNKYFDKKIGVIWIDAHADLHSPYTSPSGNVHGMALGALLGDVYCSEKINDVNFSTLQQWEKLIKLGSRNIHPKIYPEDLVYIDIRDLESAEWTDIRDNKIKYFSPKEIIEKTSEKVAFETLEYLNNCDILYISFDVDSLDPAISKGTGTSSKGGISLEEAKKMLKVFYKSPKLKAIEFTEINPLLDTENKMAKTVLEIIDEIII